MLTVLKNDLVTGVSRDACEIRQKELNWWISNYWTVASQSAIICGFAFNQYTHISRSKPSNRIANACYTTLTSITLAIELYVVVVSALYCSLCQGLVLRGPLGFKSLVKANSELQKRFQPTLYCFVTGLVCFIFSSCLLVSLSNVKRETATHLATAALFIMLMLMVFGARAVSGFYHTRHTDSSFEVVEERFWSIGDLDDQVASSHKACHGS